MSKAFVIISGFNDRAVLAACRALRQAGLPFGIVSRGPSDLIESSAYAAQICSRIDRELDLDQISTAFSDVKKRLGVERLVLLPSAEYLNRFALCHRDYFARNMSCDLPLSARDVYESVSDKESFSRLCVQYGIPVPLEIDPDESPVPFVAKPRRELTRDGRSLRPRLFFSRSSYLDFASSEDRANYYFQQYVGGKSYYLLFDFRSDGRYRLLVQRNGAQQPGGRSVVLAWSARLPDEELVRRFVEMFRNLGFQGLVMVELKEQAGRYYMIEANPRLWGPLQLTLDLDPSFLQGYLLASLGCSQSVAPVPIKKRSYLWLGGIIKVLREGERLTWFEGGRARLLFELLGGRLRDVYLRADSAGVFARELRELVAPRCKRSASSAALRPKPEPRGES